MSKGHISAFQVFLWQSFLLTLVERGRPSPTSPLKVGTCQIASDQSKNCLSQMFLPNLLLIIHGPKLVCFFFFMLCFGLPFHFEISFLLYLLLPLKWSQFKPCYVTYWSGDLINNHPPLFPLADSRTDLSQFVWQIPHSFQCVLVSLWWWGQRRWNSPIPVILFYGGIIK